MADEDERAAAFVILRHDAPDGSHWDLMLDRGEALATWALDHSPDRSGPIAARRLADHRRAYLDYEGPISGGRGSVVRWDSGQYRLLSQSPQCWRLQLEGRRLSGPVLLEALPDGRWQFLRTGCP